MGINTAEKIFIGMSLENQHPNTDSVVCPLEDVFSVSFPKYNNGNLVDRTPLDMPSLNDHSPSKFTEIFDNVTFDDSNNNNYKPCDSYHFDIKSSKNNAIRSKDNNQTRALNNNFDFDGLSEFLVFHKKSDLENDPQLKGGCFVKLERIEIQQNEKQALDDQRVTRSKQKSINSVSVVLPKDVKRKKTKKEPNASQAKSVFKSQTLCDTPSVEEHPRILLRLVRKKSTNEYKIVDRIHPNDQFHAKKKLSKDFVDRPKSQFHTKNKKHSTIKNSCVDRPKSPFHSKKSSANKNHSGIKNSCADRPKSQLHQTKNSVIRNHSATKNFCVHRAPKSRFRQKKKTVIKNSFATKSCCIVIEPLPPSTHRQRVKKKRSTMDHPSDLSISNMTADQEPRNTNHKSLFDDIEVLIVPETNKNQRQEEVKCTEIQSTESVGMVPNEIVSNSVEPNIDDNANDDDNSSISSVISIHAPSISELDSPSRKDLADANSREADPRKYRIPKLNCMTGTQAFVQNSNFLTVDDDKLNAAVTAILTETTQEMPDMISPIRELDLSSIQSGSRANEKQIEYRKKRVNRFSVENQSVATRRKMNSEDMENSNEPLQSIFGVTANTTSQSVSRLTSHRSSTDWNQIGKGVVINVTDQGRSLSTSLQSTTAAPAETVTSSHLAQNPAAVTLSSPILPPSPILQPAQLQIQPVPQIQVQEASRLPIQPVPQLQVQPAARLPIYPPSLLTMNIATVPPQIHQANHPPSQLPIYQANQANVLPLQTTSNQPVPLRQPIDFLQQNQSSRNGVNIPLQMNQLSPDKMDRYRTATVALFERQCMTLLSEKPCSPRCPYNHKGLPNANKICQKMNTFPTEKILFIYQTFIVRYRETFHQYFPMICRLYGGRGGTRQTYESFVADCERYEKYEYFQYIFSELVCGKVDRRDALQLIINCCKPCRLSDQAILAILLDDPQSYIDILIKYANKLDQIILNKLLYQVSTNVNIHQLTACVQLLDVVREEIVLLIEPSVLYSFCKVVDTASPHLSFTLFQIITRDHGQSSS